MESHFTPACDNGFRLVWKSLKTMARHAPRSLLRQTELLEELEKARNTDQAAEISSAIVRRAVFWMRSSTEPAGDGVEVYGQCDLDCGLGFRVGQLLWYAGLCDELLEIWLLTKDFFLSPDDPAFHATVYTQTLTQQVPSSTVACEENYSFGHVGGLSDLLQRYGTLGLVVQLSRIVQAISNQFGIDPPRRNSIDSRL